MAHDDRDDAVMSEADEEAMRAKLREAGWDKNKILSKAKKAAKEENDDEPPAKSNGKESDDRKKSSTRDRDREGRSSRGERRRSRSARRRDRDRGDRERRRDRERGSRRRRASRSRSASKSRSRSTSVRGSSRRGRERSSRADRRRSRSVSASRSRSASKSRSKRSRRGDSKSESSPKKSDKAETTEDKPEDVKPEGDVKQEGVTVSESNVGGDAKKKMDEADKEGKKDADERKSRKSSRHRSRSASRSPSRSRRRRRRHRSPSRSRSASRSRRGRGSSRSRSRSRRRRSSRRRSSRSRTRSHSRRRRSKSRDRSQRDANSSPQPHQFPPAEVAPPNPLNPSITQLMQQYPTMSLQDIIAKMQASNVTMAAAVSMKPARELYVGNLPASVTGPQLQEFLGTIIQQVGLTIQPGNPILSTWISTDGHFAFCEMRSIEECNMALMLNQLPLLGQPLKFGRPKSFMGPPQPMPVLPPRTQTALSNLGCTPNTAWFASPATDMSSVAAMTASLAAPAVPTPITAPFVATTPAPIVLTPQTSSNKLVMSNIPVVLTEDQVKELVEPFGELKSFELLKDPVTQQSTGSALFEYVDENVTDGAKDGLDGLDLGGIPLAVRRATASEETGPVLRMANMVSIDELKDDEEFADLKEDVEEECKRFGKVVTLEIPRPKDGETVAGLGDIFVQFETSNEAAAALKALSGRKFGGNIVKVSYFPLAKLQQKDFA